MLNIDLTIIALGFIIFVLITLLVINLIFGCKSENFEKNENELDDSEVSFEATEKLKEEDQYIFDKFIVNNELYIIFPIYDKEINENEFEIKLNNYDIKLNDVLKKIYLEPIQINIYDIYKNNDKVNLKTSDVITGTFKYKNFEDILNINPIISNKKKTKSINQIIGITTLFKDDYKLFPIFYDYYINQGIEKFYMYYNGKLNDDIKNVFDKPNVKLIEWNYRYWNPFGIKFKHHAQLGQLHNSLYKYAKPECDFIIYCDLDEYLYIPNKKIYRFINENKDKDNIQFLNYFSETLDKKIPNKLPKKIKIGDKHEFMDRSKNIYKCDSIKLLNIHFPAEFSINNPQIITDQIMFHFQSWSGRSNNDICNIIDLI